jgi:hypothetical protein
VAKIKKHVPYEIVKAANNTGDAWVSVGKWSHSPVCLLAACDAHGTIYGS